MRIVDSDTISGSVVSRAIYQLTCIPSSAQQWVSYFTFMCTKLHMIVGGN